MVVRPSVLLVPLSQWVLLVQRMAKDLSHVAGDLELDKFHRKFYPSIVFL